MKYQSQVIAAGSGSIGGCTYSRNRSGQYIRRRAMPVNPGAPLAGIMTAFFAELVDRWTTVLTTIQRNAWNTYAANVVKSGFGGGSFYWTGQNTFISMNAFRMQNGLAVTNTAPVIFADAVLSVTFVSALSAATDNFDINFVNTDLWATAVGGILGVYASAPQNPSINFFKGPYRLAGTVLGAVVPPVPPQTFASPYPLAVGQKVFFQVRASNADARISAPVRYSGIVGA
jgi:hypothetical protein